MERSIMYGVTFSVFMGIIVFFVFFNRIHCREYSSQELGNTDNSPIAITEKCILNSDTAYIHELGRNNLLNYCLVQFDVHSLYNRLIQASMTSEELQNANIYSPLGAIMFRTSFFLKPNQLVITFHNQGGLSISEINQLSVELVKLSEFLLVEKW